MKRCTILSRTQHPMRMQKAEHKKCIRRGPEYKLKRCIKLRATLNMRAPSV